MQRGTVHNEIASIRPLHRRCGCGDRRARDPLNRPDRFTGKLVGLRQRWGWLVDRLDGNLRELPARIAELFDADLSYLATGRPDPNATRRPSESKILDVTDRLDRIKQTGNAKRLPATPKASPELSDPKVSKPGPKDAGPLAPSYRSATTSGPTTTVPRDGSLQHAATWDKLRRPRRLVLRGQISRPGSRQPPTPREVSRLHAARDAGVRVVSQEVSPIAWTGSHARTASLPRR